MDHLPAVTTRTCCRCGDDRPIDEFRLKRKSEPRRRESTCRACHRRAMRSWREDQRRKVLHRFARRAPHQLLDRRFRALLVATLERLGGIESLATMLVDEIKSTRASRPHDRFPLHALTTILRLQEYVAARQEASDAAEQDECGGLTPDQIKTRIRQSIIDLIRKEPEIAIALAQSLGWTIIPPVNGSPIA